MTIEQRSRCMSRIRSTNTSPERIVRQALTLLGYRYRLHVKSLSGRPDIVIRRLKLVIFVHGCFWHRHHCKLGQATPKSNASFWAEKFKANTRRDRKARRELLNDGWRVLTIWECETSAETLLRRVQSELGAAEMEHSKSNPKK